MNEKHWGQQGLLAVMLLALICSGPNSAVGSETAKSRSSTPAISTAQGSLGIPGVTVTKGDSRESVMRQLSHLYELQKLKSAQGEEDSWLISEKQDSDNYVSVVSFAAGKIRRVARFRKWTQDDDSVELAQRLCDLLEKLTSERGNKASIEARTTDSGNVSVRGVELVFGDKRVSVNVISRGDSDSKQTEVHLDEVVQ
ncbi:MAG: hypothetical protein WBQ72_04450 [Terriglobales bacterium]|jgi:hypothetical protein